MSNPWLAIDVATAPAQRAREVRRAWERFVGGRWDAPDEDETLRVPIEQSWRRSAAAGVDPSGLRIAPVVADQDETSARWEVHPLAEAAPLIRACLAASADESQHLIVVADANGILLWVEGNPALRLRAADSMNFAEGTLWSEGGAGTNAIGTALAAEHAVQVFASEHFNEVVQSWTCAAAPVHDPDTGRVIGVIDLTGEMATVHPHSMAVATATAQAVEAHLRCEMLNRDSRLLSRYRDRLSSGSGPRALLSPTGRLIAAEPMGWLPARRLTVPRGGGELTLAPGVMAVAEALGAEEAYLVRGGLGRMSGIGARSGVAIPDTQPMPGLSLLGSDGHARLAGAEIPLRLRHAEILTLLCSRPEGLSGEQLAGDVYGDPTRAGGIRVEISRLRKLLGDVIYNEPYRLRAGVSSDVAQVCGLLHRGEVRDAAARYSGPLLPRSVAPGVVTERDALERWMRQSVMSGGDNDALWAWLQTVSGAQDRPAWQRLLVNLPFADPRRALAAARIAQLRQAAPQPPA